MPDLGMSVQCRNSDCMRALGRFLLRKAEEQRKRGDHDAAKENYKRALEGFERSLALNALQPDLWFSCGCCAQYIDDFATAAKAFRRKVDLDSDVWFSFL